MSSFSPVIWMRGAAQANLSDAYTALHKRPAGLSRATGPSGPTNLTPRNVSVLFRSPETQPSIYKKLSFPQNKFFSSLLLFLKLHFPICKVLFPKLRSEFAKQERASKY